MPFFYPSEVTVESLEPLEAKPLNLLRELKDGFAHTFVIYFDCQEDQQRLNDVMLGRSWGEMLLKRLSDDHRWDACKRFDYFRKLCKRINTIEAEAYRRAVA